MTNLPSIITNEATVSSAMSGEINAFFNRGLISTQRVSRAFKGKPGKQSLLVRVADEKDPLRASLSGDMVEALTGFVDRAKSSGKIYAALYELGDEESLAIIEGNKNLAVAYATHVLDVYDHFAFRYMVKQKGQKGADQMLKEKPDEWLSQYFDAAGEIKTAQLKFWMQATG
jgi:hypothetical protein